MSVKSIDISVLNWGPCVIKLKINDDLKKILIDDGLKATEDYKNKLAGIIDNEKGYSDETRGKVVPYLSQYLGFYDEAYQRFVNKKYEKKPEYILTALWVNYQKANEFNPPPDRDWET